MIGNKCEWIYHLRHRCHYYAKTCGDPAWIKWRVPGHRKSHKQQPGYANPLAQVATFVLDRMRIFAEAFTNRTEITLEENAFHVDKPVGFVM